MDETIEKEEEFTIYELNTYLMKINHMNYKITTTANKEELNAIIKTAENEGKSFDDVAREHGFFFNITLTMNTTNPLGNFWG
jgi:hypothetical protein